MTHTHISIDGTFLDEGSACRSDLTNNTHKGQTSMPFAGYERATPASERPQTRALESAVAGILVAFLPITVFCENTVSRLYSVTLVTSAERASGCQDTYSDKFSHMFNPLTPNGPYRGRTAPLTSKRCILYIYSTNIFTEYFKHGIYPPFFSLQNLVCFIILTYLVPLLFTFYIFIQQI